MWQPQAGRKSTYSLTPEGAAVARILSDSIASGEPESAVVDRTLGGSISPGEPAPLPSALLVAPLTDAAPPENEARMQLRATHSVVGGDGSVASPASNATISLGEEVVWGWGVTGEEGVWGAEGVWGEGGVAPTEAEGTWERGDVSSASSPSLNGGKGSHGARPVHKIRGSPSLDVEEQGRLVSSAFEEWEEVSPPSPSPSPSPHAISSSGAESKGGSMEAGAFTKETPTPDFFGWGIQRQGDVAAATSAGDLFPARNPASGRELAHQAGVVGEPRGAGAGPVSSAPEEGEQDPAATTEVLPTAMASTPVGARPPAALSSTTEAIPGPKRSSRAPTRTTVGLEV